MGNAFGNAQPSSVAMAWAAMASPRPISPVPSFVFAFRLICSAAIPRAFRQRNAHRGEMRAQLGAFADDHRIQMIHTHAPLVEQPPRVFEKDQARHALPLRVGIWKVRSDVSEPCGAQQRVAKGMAEHVAVGMAHGAFIERNVDSANHQLAAFR